MKKVLALVIVLSLLSGCAYYKNTMLRIKADVLKLEPTVLGGTPKIEGDKISGTLNRQVYLGGSSEIPDLLDIEIKESEDTVKITK